MDVSSSFLLYAMAFRLAVIAAGVLVMVLGYRLFLRGVDSAGGDSETRAEGGGFKLTLKNTAPGTAFALFGALLIGSMVVRDSPQLLLEDLAERGEVAAAQRLQLRGSAAQAPDGNEASAAPLRAREAALAAAAEQLLQAGYGYETAGEPAQAVQAYTLALVLSRDPTQMARPLNQLAWNAQQQQQLALALPLAQLAHSLVPDHTAYLDTLAQVQWQRGQVDDALRLARRAVQLDPDDPDLAETLRLIEAGR